jgi:hypothetical protein
MAAGDALAHAGPVNPMAARARQPTHVHTVPVMASHTDASASLMGEADRAGEPMDHAIGVGGELATFFTAGEPGVTW